MHMFAVSSLLCQGNHDIAVLWDDFQELAMDCLAEGGHIHGSWSTDLGDG